jgi:hypothetical protein
LLQGQQIHVHTIDHSPASSHTSNYVFTTTLVLLTTSLTDSENGSVLATESSCRPSKHTLYNTVKSTLSNESVIMISTTSGNTDTIALDTVQNPKKLKMSASSGDHLKANILISLSLILRTSRTWMMSD